MHKRVQALLYLAIVISGLLVLAGGLENLEFQPALPIPGAEADPGAPPAQSGASAAGHVTLQMLLQTGLGLGFIFLLALLMISLVRKANLKKLARLSAGLAAVVLLMFLVGFLKLPQPDSTTIEMEEAAPAAVVGSYQVAPIGDPPAGLIEVILYFVLAGAAALAGWLLYRALHQKEDEDPLAVEAAAALSAIGQGQDLRDVILTCYLHMTRVVRSGRGLEREEFMTPREFEDLLSARGIPADPVRRLTRLFEKARYGRSKPGRQDENDAIDCLNAIRMVCSRKAAV